MKKIIALAFVVSLCMLPLFVDAAPFPDSDTPCDGPFGGPCPIDGGISFLIAAGLAYGGKKAYDISRKNQ